MKALTTTTDRDVSDTFERPPVQWWPLRPRYLRRIRDYLAYAQGRCDPVALVEESDGNRFEATIVRPARHAFDTWEVKAYRRKGYPVYEVTTREILEIQCGRALAGYPC